jgi:hypothetical protein
MLGDFGFFLVADLGGLSPLYMDRDGTVAPATAAAAAFCGTAEAFSVVEVDAFSFCIGIVGVFCFVVEGSSSGRPPANVVKDRETRQRRNAV